MGRYADRLKKEKEYEKTLLRDEAKKKSESYAERYAREREAENAANLDDMRKYIAEQSAKRSAQRGENALLVSAKRDNIKKGDINTFTKEKIKDRYASKLNLNKDKEDKIDFSSYQEEKKKDFLQ